MDMTLRFAVTFLGVMGAVALMAFPCLAQDIEEATITTRVGPTCGLTAQSPSQTLAGSMIDDDGYVAGPALQSAIVQSLNAAQVTGFCTGSANTLTLTRTPFTRNNVGTLQGTFARAVLYDIQVAVGNDEATFTDSSADGPQGGSQASRFGPTGTGASFVFSSVPDGQGGALTVPVAIVTGNAAADGPTTSFSNRPNVRLAAGTYGSTVTLELAPGL